MSGFIVRLFGEFALEPSSQPLSRKGEWLMSLLVLRHGRELERAWLAGTLWPDTNETLALYNLRRELSHLRRALGPEKERLQSSSMHVIALDVSGATVDVIDFDAAVARGDESSLEQAVASYTGPLLQGTNEDWVVEEREARAQAYLAALESLATLGTARGDPATAVRHLRLAVAADPLRESVRRRLIEALAATGAYAAALQTYRDLRLLLERDLQTVPAPETRALHERLVGEARAKASAPTPEIRGRIPRPLTPLVGRLDEIREVAAQIGASRLVTLVGAGGVGKSRLGVEVSQALVAQFGAGAWFVELAPVADPSLVPSAVAATMGLRDPSPRPMIEALREFVRDQPLLLVLDNCEHLITACAELVTALLASCGGLRVLVTGRQPLGIVGEIVWRVPSLVSSDAVQLFLERAEEAQVTSLRSKLGTVALVCSRLDGIPLAIELAAARTKALSIDDVASRLDDRFRLLTGGSRTALPRHQTLRATMDWSYHLLDHVERQLLRRLAVFAGGWTLEAAEAICGSGVLETLSGLVDKSLVVFDERYRMLETVRQYALEQLSQSGEESELRDRHLSHFVAFAEEVRPHIWGGERDKAWMNRLEREHDNVRAAFDWAEANATGAEAALRLAHAVQWFWFARGHVAEGHQRLMLAMRRREGVPDPVRANGLVAAGYVSLWAGDFGRLGEIFLEAQQFAERIDDAEVLVYARCGLAVAALYAGNAAEALPLLERAVVLARGVVEPTPIILAYFWLGCVNEAIADFAEARRALGEALAVAMKEQFKPPLAHTLYRLGHVAHGQGQHAEARLHYVRGLEVLVETGDYWGMSQVLDALGCLGIDRDAGLAVMLLGAADALRQRMGAQILPTDRENHERAVRAAREAQGDEAFSDAWTRGRALPIAEALEIARTFSRGGDDASPPDTEVSAG